MSRSAGADPVVLDRPAGRDPRSAWRTVNITPVERLGRIVVGLGAVAAGIVLPARGCSRCGTSRAAGPWPCRSPLWAQLLR